MTTSTSWTLFDVADGTPVEVPGHPGVRSQALVDNTDIGGSSLLGVWYEPGVGDDHRSHAVGQVILVLEGQLRIEGQPCGPGAGCFAPEGRSYAVEAGPDGAMAVEFRPAPITYGSGSPDDARMEVKPPTTPRPDLQWGWEVMGSAGPATSVKELSYFDIASMPEQTVSPEMTIQALVNHVEDDGQSMLMVRHWPNSITPTHSHDVDQIVVVLDGAISQGNRTFRPGTGFFTPKGKKYMLRAEDEGTVRVEWRPAPLRFSTDWAGDPPASPDV